MLGLNLFFGSGYKCFPARATNIILSAPHNEAKAKHLASIVILA